MHQLCSQQQLLSKSLAWCDCTTADRWKVPYISKTPDISAVWKLGCLRIKFILKEEPIIPYIMMGTVNNAPGCELKQITGGQSGIYLGGPQVWAGWDVKVWHRVGSWRARTWRGWDLRGSHQLSWSTCWVVLMTLRFLAQLKAAKLTQKSLWVPSAAPHTLCVKLRVTRCVSDGSPQAVFACLASIWL